jgi:hypothetical protein
MVKYKKFQYKSVSLQLSSPFHATMYAMPCTSSITVLIMPISRPSPPADGQDANKKGKVIKFLASPCEVDHFALPKRVN